MRCEVCKKEFEYDIDLCVKCAEKMYGKREMRKLKDAVKVYNNSARNEKRLFGMLILEEN